MSENQIMWALFASALTALAILAVRAGAAASPALSPPGAGLWSGL